MVLHGPFCGCNSVMDNKQLDYIIVGQGLAGTTLAWQLHALGQRVAVINTHQPNSSSMVAAGLYNPVTGRKMVKTWLADRLFPAIEPFYEQLQQLTGQQFLHPVRVYRPFVAVQEQNEWHERAATPVFAPYVAQVHSAPQYAAYQADPLGGICLGMSGYLDVPAFLLAMRQWFTSQGMYIEGHFEAGNLQLTEEALTYGNFTARGLIFCEGTAAQQNPWFGWLPFRPVKGQTMLLAANAPLQHIVNRGVFVIPKAPNRLKVGATYQHHDSTPDPTAEGLQQLTGKLNQLMQMPYEVVGQSAGIRPATADRRPFLGRHPAHKQLAIMNGLGSKGVSLAPYFAGQLAAHLVNGAPLQQEVNIHRFFSLYYKHQ